MIRFSGLAVGIVVLAGSIGAAQAPAGGGQAAPPPPMTSLQISPKDTPRPQITQTMQPIAGSLGVQGNYCHVQEGRGDQRSRESRGARSEQRAGEDAARVCLPAFLPS